MILNMNDSRIMPKLVMFGSNTLIALARVNVAIHSLVGLVLYFLLWPSSILNNDRIEDNGLFVLIKVWQKMINRCETFGLFVSSA